MNEPYTTEQRLQAAEKAEVLPPQYGRPLETMGGEPIQWATTEPPPGEPGPVPATGLPLYPIDIPSEPMAQADLLLKQVTESVANILEQIFEKIFANLQVAQTACDRCERRIQSVITRQINQANRPALEAIRRISQQVNEQQSAAQIALSQVVGSIPPDMVPQWLRDRMRQGPLPIEPQFPQQIEPVLPAPPIPIRQGSAGGGPVIPADLQTAPPVVVPGQPQQQPTVPTLRTAPTVGDGGAPVLPQQPQQQLPPVVIQGGGGTTTINLSCPPPVVNVTVAPQPPGPAVEVTATATGGALSQEQQQRQQQTQQTAVDLASKPCCDRVVEQWSPLSLLFGPFDLDWFNRADQFVGGTLSALQAYASVGDAIHDRESSELTDLERDVAAVLEQALTEQRFPRLDTSGWDMESTFAALGGEDVSLTAIQRE